MRGQYALRLAVVAILLGLVLTPACVKIQTGQTEEEARESSTRRAQGLRAQWADRLQHASVADTPELFLQYFERVSNSLLEYGNTVLSQWRQGEAIRDTAIEATEMRDVINQMLTNERPILMAWEDNLEYGVQYIEDLRQFDERTIDELRSFLDLYYDIYSVIILPDGTSHDYAEDQDDVRLQIDRKPDELRRSGW